MRRICDFEVAPVAICPDLPHVGELRRAEFETQQTLGLEVEVARGQSPEALEQQAGTYKQHHGYSHLTSHQSAAQTLTSALRTCRARGLLKHMGQVRSERRYCGRQTEHQAGDNRSCGSHR